MTLQDYLNKLKAALLTNEGIVSVENNQNFLDENTRRVVASYTSGRRATRFISANDVASLERIEDGVDLERFLKVVAFGLEKEL